MSGVTEVRLYRNTVDEVPAEYTNVTAAVLNSSTKNHATGVKRYLDGVTTADGLAGGTNYFWVELIDARGNTAGPQPVGSYTAPTVWEFFVSVPPPGGGGVWLFAVDSSFGDSVVIPDSTWKLYFRSSDRNTDATPYYFTLDAGFASRKDYVYSQSIGLGDLMWTMVDPSMNNSASFTVNWARP